MSDGKGKGRAINQEDADNPDTADQSLSISSSILERVAASAGGLVRSAFTAPASNELSDAVSVARTSTGKSQQSGESSSHSSAECSRSHMQTQLPALQGKSLPSFRVGHREEHIKAAESEFSSFLEGIDSFTPSELLHQADPFPGQATDRQLEVANIRAEDRHGQTGEIAYNTVDEQRLHDGDAVLSILSNLSATMEELEAAPADEEPFNWNLTDQQVSHLRMLVDKLFPPADQHTSMSAQHPLNLVPSMFLTSANSNPLLWTNTNLEESYLHFGRDTPRDAARQMWMNQWDDVLTRYTDEVWGDLLPLVAEARGEINAMKENPPGTIVEQSKALRRLGMVLNQVRKL